jgi:hypothetical protein
VSPTVPVRDTLLYDELLVPAPEGDFVFPAIYGVELVVDTAGNPVIGFIAKDADPGTFWLARCSDPLCAASPELLRAPVSDQAAFAGLLPNGRALFFEGPWPGRYLVVCDDVECTNTHDIPLDGSLEQASETVGPLGPVFGWVFNTEIMAGACADTDCSELTIAMIGSGTDFGRLARVWLNPSGSIGALWQGLVQTGWQGSDEPLSVGEGTWLTTCSDIATCETDPTTAPVPMDGIPLIGPDGSLTIFSYPDDTHPLGAIVVCPDPLCTESAMLEPGWAAPFVFDPEFPEEWISEAIPMRPNTLVAAAWIGRDDNPAFAFFIGAAGSLYVTHCDDPLCATGQTTRAGEFPGVFPFGDFDVALDADGLPLIAVAAGDGLHLLRCLDPACSPTG